MIAFTSFGMITPASLGDWLQGLVMLTLLFAVASAGAWALHHQGAAANSEATDVSRDRVAATVGPPPAGLSPRTAVATFTGATSSAREPHTATTRELVH